MFDYDFSCMAGRGRLRLLVVRHLKNTSEDENILEHTYIWVACHITVTTKKSISCRHVPGCPSCELIVSYSLIILGQDQHRHYSPTRPSHFFACSESSLTKWITHQFECTMRPERTPQENLCGQILDLAVSANNTETESKPPFEIIKGLIHFSCYERSE